jgi:hypothetical protein
VGLPSKLNDIDNWGARGTLLFEPAYNISFLLSAHGSRRDEWSRVGQAYGTNGFYCLNGDIDNCWPPARGRYPEGSRILNVLGGTQGQSGYQAREVRTRLEQLAPCLKPVPGRPQGTCDLAGPEQAANRASANAAKLQVARELARDLDSEPWAGDFNMCSPDKDIDPNRPGVQCDDDTGKTQNDTWGVYLKGDIDLPWEMRLTSVSGYDTYDRFIDIDQDYSPETLFHITTDDEGWQATQDLRLQGQFGDEVALRWDIGGWFLREQLEVMVANDLGEFSDFGVGQREYTQDLWSAAGYGSLAIDFWDDFTLDGGFRYNWEQKKLDFVVQYTNLTDLGTGEPRPFPAKLNETWDAPTGTVRLTYRFREDTHVFWKYTRGWKPGTFNATSALLNDPFTGVPYANVSSAQPEEIDSFETGIRGSWFDDNLTIDFSFFYYSYTDYQIFTAQQFENGQPEFVILNADDAEVYGAELDAAVRPWEGAFINVRFGWLESQFLDFVQLQQERVLLGNQRVTVNRELQNTGNNLLNSPEYKVSLTAEQTFPIGLWGSITARYDAVWTDTTYYDATQGFLPDARQQDRSRRLGAQPRGQGLQDVRVRRQHLQQHDHLQCEQSANLRRHPDRQFLEAATSGSRSQVGESSLDLVAQRTQQVEFEFADLPRRRLAPAGLGFVVGVRRCAEPCERLGIFGRSIAKLARVVARVEEFLAAAISGLFHAHVAVRTVDDRNRGQGAVVPLCPVLVEVGDRGRTLCVEGLPRRARQDLREPGATVDPRRRFEAQQVEQRRPDVDVARARFHDDAGFEAERKREQERNLRRFSVDPARMSLEAALEEGLAVVRSDGDDRVVELAEFGEGLEQDPDRAVGPADRVVVDVRVGGAEERGLFVVDVLVEVHQVQVEEPAPLAVDAQELDGGFDQAFVGTLFAECRVFAPNLRWQGPRDGALVDLEALVEAEGRGDPAVAIEPDRLEARFAQNLRRHLRSFRDHVVEARDAGPSRVEPGPEGGHRRLGPGRLRELAIEAHTRVCQSIEDRARVALVTVATEALGAKRVDQDEQHVQVVVVADLCDVLAGPARAAIPAFRLLALDQDQQECDQAEASCNEPGPTLIEQSLLHGTQPSAATPGLVRSHRLCSPDASHHPSASAPKLFPLRVCGRPDRLPRARRLQ